MELVFFPESANGAVGAVLMNEIMTGLEGKR